MPSLNFDFGAIQVPGQNSGGQAPTGTSSGGGAINSDDPAVIRDMLLNSPHDLAILKERNPPLADALLSGDLGEFWSVLAVNCDCQSALNVSAQLKSTLQPPPNSRLVH